MPLIDQFGDLTQLKASVKDAVMCKTIAQCVSHSLAVFVVDLLIIRLIRFCVAGFHDMLRGTRSPSPHVGRTSCQLNICIQYDDMKVCCQFSPCLTI